MQLVMNHLPVMLFIQHDQRIYIKFMNFCIWWFYRDYNLKN